MGQSKNTFMEVHEQDVQEQNLDLNSMMKSMLFLPTMTGNEEFVEYLKKLNSKYNEI